MITSLALLQLLASGMFSTAGSVEESLPSTPENSARLIMPGCRNFAEPRSAGDAFDQGLCIGLLKGLYYLSNDACIPPAVTVSAMTRIVVQFIDGQPSRLQEDFRELALEALRTAWPCTGTRHISFTE
jgi:hypothetical protein